MFKQSILAVCVVLSFQAAHASNITNNIMGVGPKDNPVKPYICIQNSDGQITYALAPGATVDANKYSGNPYYAGTTVRFGGCDPNKNSYLGYAGISGGKVTYSPPQGVHVQWANPAVDGNGNLTGQIQYTAINPVSTLTPGTRQNPSWNFVGANLSGLEFGKMIDPVVVPNLSSEDSAGQLSDLNDTQSFLTSGMNTLRVPLHWGFLQLDGAGKGDLNLAYFNSYVKPLLETLTQAKTYAIVDLHSYMRYSVFGKQYAGCGPDGGPCPDGTLITDASVYQDVWTKLFTLIKNDPKIDLNYVMFDLVNEPVDVPNDSVFTIQAQVIKSLRDQGFQGYILVEGNSWSGLHSWITKTWKSTDGKITYSNATLFTRDNFAKAGITDLSKILINVHQYLDSNYSGTQDQCLTDLTTTGPDGFNLNMFVDYLQQNHLKAIVTEFGAGRDSDSCSVAMTKFLNYLKDNSANNKDYGFVGWTIWSTGHGWGGYNLRVTPTSYQMKVLQNYL